jgi:dTDP-4-dehydrorhamnose reductase
VNVYGHSKAAGELATLSVDASNLVVRISSIFGAAGSSGKGKNFVETMISKAKNFESLTVVNDQHMSPTYTVDASTIILAAIQGGLNGKIHAANTGSTTWFNFTNEILKLTNLKADLLETSTDKEKRPLRPINSALDTSRIAEILKVGTSWQNALERYLHEKGHI